MTLEELFRRIERTRSLSALWALMVRYYRGRGFESMAYVLFDRGRLGEAVALLEHGVRPDAIRTYEELGFGKHDPTLRVAMATGQPQVPRLVAKRFKLSREEKQYRAAIDKLLLTDGLGMPLFGPHGRDAYAMLGNPVDRDLIKNAKRTELHMAAQAAHLRTFALQPGRVDGEHDLSEREVEILRWVARGKSNNVIAEILSLSPGTVDTYLRRIFEKLGVTDRTSAAVKGVGLGLIRI